METRRGIKILAFVVAMVVAAGPLAAQEQAPEMDEAMQAMMAAYAEYAEVGREHELMARAGGEWKVRVKMWTSPGTPPMVSEGTSSVKLIMDGRYMLEEYNASTPMGHFEGLGLHGYDNIKNRYVGVWIDSMSTGIMRAEGTANEDASVLSFTGESPDPVAGAYKQQRSTMTIVDANTHRFETFEKTPDGTEWRNMEILYERR